MRTLITTLVLCSIVSTAQAQNTVKLELRLLTAETSDRPLFGANALIEHTYTPRFKAWTWLQVEEKWAEAYFGMAYVPTTWFEFGLAGGIEQANQPWRLGGYVWMGNKYVSFLALAEEGGSGPWYQATLLGRVSSWLEFGAMTKRFVGLGYRIDFSLPTGPKIKFWAAHLLFNPEANSLDPKKFLMGLSCSF